MGGRQADDAARADAIICYRAGIRATGDLHRLSCLGVVCRADNTANIIGRRANSRCIGAVCNRTVSLDAADHAADALCSTDRTGKNLNIFNFAVIDNTSDCCTNIGASSRNIDGCKLNIFDCAGIKNANQTGVVSTVDFQVCNSVPLTVEGALKGGVLCADGCPRLGECDILQQLHGVAVLGRGKGSGEGCVLNLTDFCCPSGPAVIFNNKGFVIFPRNQVCVSAGNLIKRSCGHVICNRNSCFVDFLVIIYNLRTANDTGSKRSAGNGRRIVRIAGNGTLIIQSANDAAITQLTGSIFSLSNTTAVRIAGNRD